MYQAVRERDSLENEKLTNWRKTEVLLPTQNVSEGYVTGMVAVLLRADCCDLNIEGLRMTTLANTTGLMTTRDWYTKSGVFVFHFFQVPNRAKHVYVRSGWAPRAGPNLFALVLYMAGYTASAIVCLFRACSIENIL